jgi:hypothetical protein
MFSGYHTLLVWNIKKDTFIPVCTFREEDPGSGITHIMYWSDDSKMLHIYGMRIINEAKGYVSCDVLYPFLLFNDTDNLLYNVIIK